MGRTAACPSASAVSTASRDRVTLASTWPLSVTVVEEAVPSARSMVVVEEPSAFSTTWVRLPAVSVVVVVTVPSVRVSTTSREPSG